MGGAPISVIEEGDLRIVKIGPDGPGSNNAYIVRDTSRGESLLVDMPVTDGTLLEAIASEGTVRQIVATHWHPDHWTSYDAVRTVTAAPVLVGDKEIRIPEHRIDGRLADGDEIRVGATRVSILHTPGHTPGSIALRVGRTLIGGDTLFRDGPGKTWARGDLEVLLETIVAKLLCLPPETVVLPGHGADVTIGEAAAGYEAYRAHPKPPGFFGDVSWRE